MSTGLRTTFWLHAVAAIVFAIGYLFLPTFVVDFFGLEPIDPNFMALYGAATLALGLSSVLAALAKDWEHVAIIAETEVIFTALSVVVCLYAVLFAGASTMVWLAAALFGVFLLLFGYFAWQERSVHAVTPGTPAMR